VGHPFAILDGADWVSPEQVEAARVFKKFLLSDERQRALMNNGLRPADPRATLTSPIDRANGANPEANLVAVSVPDVLVVDRITEVWHRVKKHAAIALVFDKSGSMSGAKITAATKGAQEFVRRMDRDDQIIWMPFDSTVYAPVKGNGSDVGEELAQGIGSTIASGGTALYDAVLRAHEQLESLRKNDPIGTRYGIVVLSDGQDTNSKASLSLVESRLSPQEGDPTGIQIHTIAIGSDADEPVLKKIANAAHGRYWKGQTAQDMVVVYKTIATYY
jgi:Ca-activated chloride channel family protein